MEQIENIKEWTVLTPTNRVDAFNKSTFEDDINGVIGDGQKRVAIDFSNLKFLSYPSIKFLSAKAETLKKEGGTLALCSASEKLKKQISIYATLENMMVFRSKHDLVG